MNTHLLRSSLLACLLASPLSHAGFLDTLNEATKALDTIEKTLKNPLGEPKKKEEPPAEKKPSKPSQAATPPKAEKPVKAKELNEKQQLIATQPASTAKKSTKKSGKSKSGGQFATYNKARIELPYDQCPKTDVLGLKLGQNISEIMPSGPFYFRRATNSDSPTFDDSSTDNGFDRITVFSTKFEELRLNALNSQFRYDFDQNEYNKIKELDKQASRHGLTVWLDFEGRQDHPLIKDKNVSYVNLVLDVNGDINHIYVTRTLPVKISKTAVEEKLKAKYGEKRNPKDKNRKTIYVSSWGTRVEQRKKMKDGKPTDFAQSTIDYQLSCEVAKRASEKHHKKLRKQWNEIAESMRDNSGATVDI